MSERRWMRRALALMALSLVALSWGCAGLVPPELEYRVHMEPDLPEGRGDIYVDLEDSATVFSKEGLLIRVRHLTDEELNDRFPPLFDGRNVNPYTRDEKDPELGYVLPRFTVFEVSVTNNTYAKVELDPAKTVLESAGETYRYYDPGREGAVVLGGNSFSKYYKMELGTSGNEREVNLERMGIIYKTVYHRDRPIFRGDTRTGMIVFDPLPPENDHLTLKVNEFVLSFDASGNPEETIDVEFDFVVDQGVVDVSAGK
jgi:hypothetical protein